MVDKTRRSDSKWDGWTPERTAWTVVIVLAVCLLLMVLPSPRDFQESRWMTSFRNLKNIGLAIQNYTSRSEGFLPNSGTFTDDGQPLHGWQTTLLPWLDQAALYERIDHDIPWNDPRQGDLFQIRLDFYLNPLIGDPEVVDGFAASHYAANERLLLRNGHLSLDDLSHADGCANTLLLGDVSSGFRPWGAPNNVRDPAAGIGTGPDQFGVPYENHVVAHFIFADNHFQTISDDIDPAVLRALATPDGGESIPDF